MAAEHESTMQWKVDITQLKAAMQEAKRSIASTNAEFKTATAGMDKWSKSTDGLQAKIEQLNKLLPAQERVLEVLEAQYKETAKTMGENSSAAHDLKIKIEEQKATIAKTETSIKTYNDKLSDMKAQQAESETATGKLSQKIEEQEKELADLKKAYQDAVLEYGKNSKEAKDLAKQISDLSGDLKDNKTQMQQASDAADDLDRSMDDLDTSSRNASEGFTVFKGALANLISQGISKVISGVKDLARETFNVGANFEASMSKVAAISGATGDELDALTEKAKEMGSSTKFTATEAAEAFTYMAMAGWKTEDMLGGIEGIMNLAAASGADLATTSDIVTDALTAMGYSAKDAGRLADVMAAASSNANTNVEMMGATFQYAAPIIGALGYSMEDAAVAIGLMANAGIKGEKAGTALRSILTRLAAPPKECAEAMDELGISLTDSEGNMKSMDEVVQDLRTAFDGLSETEQTTYAKHIAGQEAMSGLLAVVRAAPEDFEKLTLAVEGSTGAAENMANTMNDNVSGKITLLKSKIEGIMIKVFDKMSGSIKKALDTVSKALDNVDWDKFADHAGKAAEKVADFFSWVLKHGDAIVSVLKAIAVAFITYKAVSTITSVINAFTTLFDVLKTGESIMAAFNGTMAANPYALIAAGIAALTMLLIDYTKKQMEAAEAASSLSEEQQASIDKVSELSEKYKELDEARNNSVAQINTEYGYLQELKDEYNGLIDEQGNVKEGYEDRAAFIKNELAQAMGIELDQLQELIDQNGKLGDAIDEVLRKKQAEAVLTANEQIYTEAIQNRAQALQDLTEAQKVVTEAEQIYADTAEDAQRIWDNYYALLDKAPDKAQNYLDANWQIINSNDVAKKSYEEAKATVEDAEQAWIGYNATIQNYEGLAAAIISGDADKINSAMNNMVNNFITAETGNRESLERQVKNYKDNLAALEQAIEDGTPSVTQDMVDQAKSMVDAANAELDKLPPEATVKGKAAGSNFANELGAKRSAVASKAGELADQAEMSVTPAVDRLSKAGSKSGKEFASGVGSKANLSSAKTSGENLADEAVEGASTENGANGGANKSGSNFGEGFFNGIGSWLTSVWERGKALAKKALAGLKAGQEEGSPSKLTRQSGLFFGEGYALGIEEMVKPVVAAATSLAHEAVNALSTNINAEMYDLGVDGGNSLIAGMRGVMPDMSASIGELKQSVAASSDVVSGVGAFSAAGATNNTQNIVFNQNINSPKAVDRLTLYRETNSLLFSAKVGLANV